MENSKSLKSAMEQLKIEISEFEKLKIEELQA